MSWSRFGPGGGSDVYTFPAAHGAECCACKLLDQPDEDGSMRHFCTFDLDDFLDHIAAHEAAGHNVPPGLADYIADDWGRFFTDGKANDL